MYDIAVIGGGPAGLSAAIQVRARNKSVLVVSGDDRDNPLYKTSRIDNYLGFYNVTGPELLERFRTHAGQMGAERRDGRVLNLLAVGGAYYLSIGSEVEQARAVVLATGVVRAKKYPGEAERLGAGVSYCATCDGMLYRGREIAVVGKTADAPQEANYLRELGCRVTYVGDQPPEGLRPDIPFVKATRLEVLGEKKVEALRAGSVTLPWACSFSAPLWPPPTCSPAWRWRAVTSKPTGTWPPTSQACSPRGTVPACPSRCPRPWGRARWRATGHRNT